MQLTRSADYAVRAMLEEELVDW